jgi:hypothetical protein
MLPAAAGWFGSRGRWLFQQDNAPPHVAVSTRQWLSDHRVQVLQWPTMSPDLNPIENMWAFLKQKLHLRSTLTSRENVIVAVQEIWSSVEARELCKTLVESMHSRLFNCVRNHGGGGVHWLLTFHCYVLLLNVCLFFGVRNFFAALEFVLFIPKWVNHHRMP